MRRKEIISAICFIAALAAFICVFSTVLMPKRTSYGATWGAFLLEEKNSCDILFFGSSLVYCDVMPAELTERTGRSAYLVTGPAQPIPTTYYYMKEAYRTQSPDIVFVEVSGVFYDRYQDYTKANIGYMPWSLNRIEATLKTAEPEERWGLLFPLYNYHDRWYELRPNDFKGYDPDPRRGYTLLSTAAAIEGVTVREVTIGDDMIEDNISYLKKIYNLCKEKGSRPVFYITPYWHRWEEEYVSSLREELKSLGDLTFIDFNECFDQMGFDPAADFFDNLHLNEKGAKKFSAFLADYIISVLAI